MGIATLVQVFLEVPFLALKLGMQTHKLIF